jgi:hypothetical protein
MIVKKYMNDCVKVSWQMVTRLRHFTVLFHCMCHTFIQGAFTHGQFSIGAILMMMSHGIVKSESAFLVKINHEGVLLSSVTN